MAFESVEFVLPNIGPLSFQELAEFRAETHDFLQPPRRAMLKLSKRLNAAILSDASLVDVRKEAKFIVETTVAPELAHMREEVAQPSRVVDLAIATPEIVGAFRRVPRTALCSPAGLAEELSVLMRPVTSATDVLSDKLEQIRASS